MTNATEAELAGYPASLIAGYLKSGAVRVSNIWPDLQLGFQTNIQKSMKRGMK
jgi:hypothetical protein